MEEDKKVEEFCTKVIDIFKGINKKQLKELRLMLELKRRGYQIIIGDSSNEISDFLDNDFEFELIEQLVQGFENKVSN